MSVEEIRAQRRDLGDEEEEEEEHRSASRTPGVELSENGSIHLETTNESNGSSDDSPKDTLEASSTNTVNSKDQEEGEKVSVDTIANPPVGSLAELSISPPGSPAPTSPVITMNPSERMKSPAPSSSPGSRPVTQSRSNEAYLQTVLKRRASNSADDFAEKMRTAAVMLAQLSQQQAAQQAGAGANGNTRVSSQSRSSIKAKANSVEDIRAKIIKEMMALEEQRMQRMKLEGVSSGVGGGGGEGAGSEMLEDERKVMANVTTDDPSGMTLYSYLANCNPIFMLTQFCSMNSNHIFPCGALQCYSGCVC